MIRKTKKPNPFHRTKLSERFGLATVSGFLGRWVRRLGHWCLGALGFLRVLLIVPVLLLRAGLFHIAVALLYSWSNVRWRTVWFALPFAVAVCGGIFLAVTCRASSRPSELTREYLIAAGDAMSRKDFRAAELYYERLTQIPGGRENAALYSLALAAKALGKNDRVNAVLAELAPLDRPGYGRAHLWQAQRLADKGPLTKVELQQVNTHLQYAVKLEPNNAEARALLGAYYMNTNQFALAEQHLTVAVRERPSLCLPLAKAHAFQGHVEQARTYGKSAREYYRQQVAGDPRSVELRLGWADATMFLTEFREAVAILKGGLNLSDENAFHQALTRVYITWSDSIKGDTIDARRERLTLLAAGLDHNPNDATLFDRIMAILRENDAVAGSARQFLLASIAQGESAKICHLLLGTDEGERGNYDLAIKHLERAHALDSSMPIVANNLAWYLLQAEDIDLKRAYELVSALAERWPLMGAIHDTRGQILAKMGRWPEALAELEKGLPQMRGQASTHIALVEVYDQLGMKELADEHRKVIAKLGGKAF